MDKYSWQNHLEQAYNRYPEADGKPVIGITANYGDQTAKLAEGYYKSLVQVGAVPVIIPPTADIDVVINTLERLDGLILSGGGDYDPRLCGEEPWPTLGTINAERDLPELYITRLAYNRNMPILGICRGMQTLAMALGGHVRQDISDIQQLQHSQEEERTKPTHTVEIVKGSVLDALYRVEETSCDKGNTSCDKGSTSCDKGNTLLYDVREISVNSFHHQAVDDVGRLFRVCARSSDGIIEAMESANHKAIIGVQWHPECLTGVWDAEPWTAEKHATGGQPLFRWLADEAKCYRAAHRLHDHMQTLDSHCDTPMFFPQGVNFAHRDPRILTDLHKMTDGRLDATIMAAYIPQPKEGQTFCDIAPLAASTPGGYADIIFDKIEDIVCSNAQQLAIARTPDELAENKREGRKSIMLAIENGLAIGGDIDRLRHFAQRGIVYMTLCHNGDNDICDSAKGNTTHGGVSNFGREVIEQMNSLGVMVDMSHASEQSFYDALEISCHPIVCSHSNCRALCDHPRNLTDQQMRALAAKGGVMQITLYPGFLRKADDETSTSAAGAAFSAADATPPAAGATILDAIRHLEHAIAVMGIDHVGIGTDFDGDGGVPGFADASDAINMTRHLLRRGFTAEEIEKIWGGNFLRVMTEVQKDNDRDLKEH